MTFNKITLGYNNNYNLHQGRYVTAGVYLSVCEQNYLKSYVT